MESSPPPYPSPKENFSKSMIPQSSTIGASLESVVSAPNVAAPMTPDFVSMRPSQNKPDVYNDLMAVDLLEPTKELYIPVHIAEGKVKELSDDLIRVRTVYEKHVVFITEKCNASLRDMKAYYEDYIRDMKKKTLDHLAFQKRAFDDKYEAKCAEVSAVEARVEELLDLNANNRFESKKKIDQVEAVYRMDLETRAECERTLCDLMGKLELKDRRVFEASHREAAARDVQRAIQERDKIKADVQLSTRARAGAWESLAGILHTIECASANEHETLSSHRAAEAVNEAVERERAANEAAAQSLKERATRAEAEAKKFMIEKKFLHDRNISLNESLQKLNVELVLQRLGFDVEIRSMKTDLAHMTEQIKSHSTTSASQAAAMESERNSLRASMEEADEKLKALMSDKEDATRKLTELEKINAMLQAELANRPVITSELPSSVQQAPAPVVVYTMSEGSKEELRELLSELRTLHTSLGDAKSAAKDLSQEKARSKDGLKLWLREFEESNGRPANNEDKEAVKELFIEQKEISNKLKNTQSTVDDLLKNISDLEQRILGSGAAVREVSGIATAKPPMPSTEGDNSGANPMAITLSQETIDAFEREKQELLERIKAISSEKDQLQSKVDGIISETRTDLVKRLEEEVNEKLAAIASLNETIASSKADKFKLETRVNELSERVTTAERELKEHEERYIKSLTESEEKRMLAEKIAQQREDIIQKTKAATAGWDAAANAEERLDVEIERAYQSGVKEGRHTAEENILLLNQAVQEKENRILEVLERVSYLEKALQDAQSKADARGGGLGAIDSEGHEQTLEELVLARQALDAAQEENMEMSNKLALAHQEIDICKEEIELYKSLLTAKTQDTSTPLVLSRSIVPPTAVESAPNDVKAELDPLEKLARDTIVDVRRRIRIVHQLYIK
jgi:chromosome segregation ATPase